MATDITGDETEFNPATSFAVKVPVDGEAASAASIYTTTGAPDTGFQRLANAVQFFRKVFRGDLTGLRAMFDGSGNATPPTWAGATPLIGTSGNCAAADPLVCLGLRDTTASAAQTRVLRTAGGAVWIVRNAYWDTTGSLWTQDNVALDSSAIFVPSSGAQAFYFYRCAAGTAPWALNSWNYGGVVGYDLTATHNVEAINDVVATRLLKASTPRSSATPGAGQAVAAGEVWKDTANFAWGKVIYDSTGPTTTLIRGANVASVVRTAAGIFTVTLQTAVPNVQCIDVTPLNYTFLQAQVDDGGGIGGSAAPTTSVFRVLLFDATGVATDPNGTNTGGFFFKVIGG